MRLVNWGKYCKNDESCLQGTTLALHTALGRSDADVDFFINRFPPRLSKRCPFLYMTLRQMSLSLFHNPDVMRLDNLCTNSVQSMHG